ncbi:MAG: hypothetical protein J6J31_13865, partial [Thermoguttaceae bacterium]|nr:hypothetical protein [Thermoguttaceae bacterium]
LAPMDPNHRIHRKSAESHRYKNIKKFLKRVSEGGTIFKMFLPHERRDMTGSQTALEECRRAWDRLRRWIPTTESIENPQNHTDTRTSKSF